MLLCRRFTLSAPIFIRKLELLLSWGVSVVGGGGGGCVLYVWLVFRAATRRFIECIEIYWPSGSSSMARLIIID